MSKITSEVEDQARKTESRETYYREGGSWAADQRAAFAKAQRWTGVVIACISAVALGEALALIALMPLKTVVPYTLLVDRQTGYVQALAPLEAQKITPDSALTQSFAVQYVIAREGFDIATVQRDYRKVALWSSEDARADYVTQMQTSSPTSPLVQYPRSTIVETFVKSVLPLGKGKVQVRFGTMRRDAGGRARALGNWVAILAYRYSSAPLSAENRFLNPLGFEVTDYRKAQEALPSAEAPPGAIMPTDEAARPSLVGRPGSAAGIQMVPQLGASTGAGSSAP